MALNRLMHPRNIYKDHPPNFRTLAEKYSDFRQYVTFAADGKVSLDFYNPQAVRCLTEKLLKEDFNLDVILPSNSLVPRIPQRLNYLLLIQDLLIASNINDDVIGIDIGTGASCIYPLLGADHCGWKFCATEINDDSISVAIENVRRNKLEEKISIFKGSESAIFKEIFLAHPDVTFTFSMCNPPFFNKEECEERFQQSDECDFKNVPGFTGMPKLGPHSGTVAKRTELWVHGGEVEFVSRIIKESQLYKNRVRVFTSMVGKKKSLAPLKLLLDEFKDVLFNYHCISQGKTQRWILVWTFDPSVKIHTKSIQKALSFPANTNKDLISYFCRICKWAKIDITKHSSGSHICFIPSHSINFKPWKDNKKEITTEPIAKRQRLAVDELGTQTEFNSDLDCGNLCIAGDDEIIEKHGLNDIAIQCCLPPYRPLNSRNMRFVISQKVSDAYSLEVDYFPCDECGFRWLSVMISYINSNPQLLC